MASSSYFMIQCCLLIIFTLYLCVSAEMPELPTISSTPFATDQVATLMFRDIPSDILGKNIVLTFDIYGAEHTSWGQILYQYECQENKIANYSDEDMYISNDSSLKWGDSNIYTDKLIKFDNNNTIKLETKCPAQNFHLSVVIGVGRLTGPVSLNNVILKGNGNVIYFDEPIDIHSTISVADQFIFTILETDLDDMGAKDLSKSTFDVSIKGLNRHDVSQLDLTVVQTSAAAPNAAQFLIPDKASCMLGGSQGAISHVKTDGRILTFSFNEHLSDILGENFDATTHIRISCGNSVLLQANESYGNFIFAISAVSRTSTHDIVGYSTHFTLSKMINYPLIACAVAGVILLFIILAIILRLYKCMCIHRRHLKEGVLIGQNGDLNINYSSM